MPIFNINNKFPNLFHFFDIHYTINDIQKKVEFAEKKYNVKIQHIYIDDLDNTGIIWKDSPVDMERIIQIHLLLEWIVTEGKKVIIISQRIKDQWYGINLRFGSQIFKEGKEF